MPKFLEEGIMVLLVADNGKKSWWCGECGVRGSVYLATTPQLDVVQLAIRHAEKYHPDKVQSASVQG